MRGRGGSVLQILVVLFILVAVNLLAQRFFVRADLTENREYTLNKATKGVLHRLDDVISVTVYFSKELPSYFATLDRQVKDLLDEYAAHAGDKLSVQFVDPGNDPALEQSLRMLGIPKLQLSTYQGERAEVMSAYLGLAVQYEGKTEVIPVVQNVARLEYDVTSAILKVSGERHTVGLALGPGATVPEEWAPVREALTEQYTVREVDLDAGDVPPEVTTLVVADREDLSEAALYRVDRFVMGGGRLFALTGGVEVTMAMLQARDREVKLGPLLRAYGVEVGNALVADAQAPLVGFDVGFFLPLSLVYPWFPQVAEKGLSRSNPVTSEMQSLVLPFVSPLTPVPVDSSAGARVTVEVLARSSERSFARPAPYDLNPQSRLAPPAGSLAPQNLVLALTGRFPSAWAGRPAPADSLGLPPKGPEVSPETQIVVSGSTHFLTAQFLRQYPANGVFLANAVDWMTMGNELIAIRSRSGAARPLKEVPDERRGLYKALAMFPVPVLVVLLGFVRSRFRRARLRRYEIEFGGRPWLPALTLLVVAVVLAGLVLLLVNPFKDPVGRDASVEALVGAPVMAQADRVLIHAPGAAATALEKRDASWVVSTQGGFPADTAAVGTILRSVGEARSSAVVSTNPANRGKFGVDTTGVSVEVLSGAKHLAHLVVGKPGQDFTTSYVRVEGENDVHVVRGLNRNLFTRPQGFRDRTLFRFDVAQVAAVTRAGDASWDLTRVDTTWAVGRPGEPPAAASAPAVDALLRALSTLSADGFLDAGADTVKPGLDPPATVYAVRFLNGTGAELHVGAKNDRNQVYARRPDRDAIYLLGEWRVQNIGKTLEELQAAPTGP